LLIAVALGGCYAAVDSQGRMVGGGQATVTVGLPAVLPPLILIEPGVRVVSDFDDEVFFVDGYYWVRRDGGWLRARDHRAGWVRVEPRYVPRPLFQAPPGRYKHYRGGEHDRRRDKDDRDHDRRRDKDDDDRGRGRRDKHDRDDRGDRDD
jgi:hypothetical protein